MKLSATRTLAVLIGATALLLALTGSALADGSQDYTLTFSGSGISGTVDLTTAGGSSPFVIQSATGTITDTDNLPGGPYTISGLSSYAGADNVLYFPDQPNVDFGGISFTTTAGIDFNIGQGGSIGPYDYVLNDNVNNPVGYCCQIGSNDIAQLDVTPSVPEPNTLALSALGLAGLGLIMLRKRALLNQSEN